MTKKKVPVEKTKRKETKPQKEKGTHGGKREGSGRQALFPGKAGNTTFSPSEKMDRRFRTKADALGVSFGDFIEAMFWSYGQHMTASDITSAQEMYESARG